MVAIKGAGSSKADGIRVAFCGSEHEKELTAPDFIQYYADTGNSEVCVSFRNDTDSPARVDRRRIRLQSEGYRGAPVADDGQERIWTIEPHTKEEVTLTYRTESLERGAELRIVLKGAVTLGDEPVELAPLRLQYK